MAASLPNENEQTAARFEALAPPPRILSTTRPCSSLSVLRISNDHKNPVPSSRRREALGCLISPSCPIGQASSRSSAVVRVLRNGGRHGRRHEREMPAQDIGALAGSEARGEQAVIDFAG